MSAFAGLIYGLNTRGFNKADLSTLREAFSLVGGFRIPDEHKREVEYYRECARIFKKLEKQETLFEFFVGTPEGA
jgi:hypothetical protein